MFEDTLLESSVKSAPILKAKHWLICIAIGAAVFAAGYFGLPIINMGADPGVIVAQSAIVASVITCWALMLCYVLADAKRYGFNGLVWFIVNLILPLVGFVIYLMYSASKTGDWKRATLPIAYIFEFIIIVLVPLIYTEA